MTATQTANTNREVTIKFLSGYLKGLTFTEITNVNYKLGQKFTDYTGNKIQVIKIDGAVVA
jgi:hypothetical protein